MDLDRDRGWFKELIASDEVAYEANVFLLRKTKAESLKKALSLHS